MRRGFVNLVVITNIHWEFSVWINVRIIISTLMICRSVLKIALITLIIIRLKGVWKLIRVTNLMNI